MKSRELSIPGAWEFTPQQFPDVRGNFLVWYDAAVFTEALGFELQVGQTNHSTSNRGAVRGVHWADVPYGQAKYIYCPQGVVLDVVIDLRVGSPTFGQHDAVQLDQTDYRAVYLSEGLGHAFIGLGETNVLSYMCSARYSPATERTINPTDPALGLQWPDDMPLVLSERDKVAQTLQDAIEGGMLPDYDECQRYYEKLRRDYSDNH